MRQLPKIEIYMILRILKFGILTTVLQLVIYWAIFKLIQKVSFLIWETEFPSDAAYFYSLGIFAFLLLIANIFSAILNTKKVHKISAYILSLLIVLAWSEDLFSWPYQTTVCIIISLITIFSKFYFNKVLTRHLSQ